MQPFALLTSLIRKKRFLCLILSCVMLFAMAGCPKTEPDPQPSSSSTEYADSQPGSSSTEQTDPQPGSSSTEPTDPQPGSSSTEPTDPTTEQQPLSAAVTGAVYNLTPNIAYKFGMVQEKMDNAVYYLTGKMAGVYLETTTDMDAAADVYIETTEGGFFIYVVTGGTKQYINMKDYDGRISCAYESSASTVYTLHVGSGNDAFYHAGTPVTTINGQKYCLGVRSDSSYTTMGPRSIEENNYYGEFYGEVIAAGCDWIVGVWQNVERTDNEFSSELWVDGYDFDPMGSGSSGGCGYVSWDLENGVPGDHWEVAPMGYPSTFIGYTFTGDQLTVTMIYHDFAEEGDVPHTDTFTLKRLDGDFISITTAGGFERIYLRVEFGTTLEELCNAFGVDYSIPAQE